MAMTIYPGQTPQSSFLSSRIQQPSTVSDLLETDNRVKTLTQNAARDVFNTTYDEHAGENIASRLGMFAVTGTIDTIDSIASIVPGIERGDVWEGAKDIGMDGMEEWRARNKSGVEMSSAMLTGVAGGVFAESVILGRVGMQLATKTGIVDSALFQAGANLLPKARATALAAQEGAALNGTAITNIYTNPALRGLMTSTALKNLGHAATAEATIAFLGQNNDGMWAETASENMFWIGLGLAIPGGLGILQGRAELRAMSNMPSILEARRAAMDPHDFAAMRNRIADPDVPYNPDMKVSESADVVQSAVEARQVIPTDSTQELRDRLSALSIQNQITLQSKTAKFAAKGLPDVESGRVISFADSSNDRPLRDHVMDAQKQDPFLFMEASNFGTANSLRGYMQSRNEKINKLAKSVFPEDQLEASRMKKKTPYVLIDKRLYPASKEALEVDRFDAKNITLTPTSNVAGVYDYKAKLPSGRVMSIGLTMKNVKLDVADIADRLGTVEAMRKLSQNIRRAGKQQPTFVLTKDADWSQYEFAIYHGKQNGKVDVSRLGLNGLNELKFEALKKKIAAMKANKDYNAYMDPWTRQKYNLPAASNMERIEDGSSKAINRVLEAVDKGQVKTWDEVNALYNDILVRNELVSKTQFTNREFEGNIWDFNRNPRGEHYKPVIIEYEQKAQTLLNRGTLEQQTEALTMNKVVRYNTLTRPGRDDSLVGEITNFIHLSPEGQKSIHIGGLADDQVTGLGQGVKAELAASLPNTFRARDSETVTAAIRLSQRADDFALARTKIEVQSLRDVAQRLNAYVNKSSRHLFDQFNSFRPGWELLEETVRGADGFHRFVLNHKSAWNRQRLGREVEEGEFLQGPNGKDLVLDDLGMEAHLAANKLRNAKRHEENRLREAMGLTKIGFQPHFVQSASVKGKYLAFVIDKNGKVVPNKTIVASTPEEFARRREETYSTLSKGEYLHTQQEIEHTQDLYDQAQQHFVDASFIGRTNISNRGGLTGNVVRQDTFGEFLNYLQDKNQHLARSTIRVVLDDQIQIAKARRAIDRNMYGAQNRILSAASKEHKPMTVWDDYLRAIVGNQMGDVPLRATTRVLNSLENQLQVYATGAWAGVRSLPMQQVTNWTRDLLTRLGVSPDILGGKGHVKDFSELTEKLGPHMPYASMQDFVNQVTKGGTPPEIRAMASKLNRWDATWRLRYFEIPNAAMNMLGIINNMPSILGAAKTPTMGQLVSTSGKKVNIVDSMKIILDGTRETLTKTHQADWAYALKHGGLKPGVAEIRELVAGIEDRNTYMKFLHGDKSLNASDKSPLNQMKRLGIDGVLGIANDTTEEWSRQWAHGIGLKLADYHGLTGEAERFNFANSIADAAIANYSPKNRGEIYQTALGSMMGLYQTYAMNYGNRMFRWAETGDYRAIMRQMATQSLFFGAKSNIGWDQVAWLEDKATGDEATLNDMVYARFGPMVGSALAHGGIGEIAQLFGADSGVALYQRADTNIRTNIIQDGVLMDPTKVAPALGTLKQVTQGIMEASKGLWSDGRISTGRHVSETLATYMPNRALRGTITVLFNEGMDIDQYGAVATEAKGVFESALRIMGLRSTRQQDEIDFKYANQASLDKTAAQMEALREDTRAAFRAGRGDLLPDIWERYQELGMSPTQFRSWIRQQVDAATTTRSLRELQRGLNSPRMQAIIARQGFVD